MEPSNWRDSTLLTVETNLLFTSVTIQLLPPLIDGNLDTIWIVKFSYAIEAGFAAAFPISLTYKSILSFSNLSKSQHTVIGQDSILMNEVKRWAIIN